MRDDTEAPGRELVQALAVIFLALALVAIAVGVRGAPPDVVAASAGAEVFSAERAMDDVRGLTSTGLPHPTGSDDHARARAYVEARLVALGLTPSVQRANACNKKRCADVENVVARIEGTEPGPALMLAAHYDSTAKGPGAADDGAGVATILEVVRALESGPPPRRSVIVLIDDGEEMGLLGARAFVAEHPLAGDVAVVLNFEARGTAGQTSMFETSEKSADLVEAYARAASRPVASSVIYALYKKLPNDTDLTVFKEAGMRGMNFAFADRVWDYHTANDTAERLDPRSLQHMGDQALATTQALLSGDIAAKGPGEAVYFDLFSATLVTYRATWALPLALLAAGLFGLGAWLSLRSKKTSLGSAARGLGATLASLIAAGAAGALVSWLIGLAVGPLSPWGKGPVAPWSAQAAAGFAAASATLIAIGPRASKASRDASGLWVGGLALWNLLSLLIAWREPGASYLFTGVALASGAALIVSSRPDPAIASRTSLGIFALALVAAVLWFPILRVLLVMIGAGLSPATTVPVALLVGVIAPLFVALPKRLRWSVPLASACVAALAVVLAMAGVGA